MSDININGQKYNFEVKGKMEVKNIKSIDEIKYDYNDNIVIKDKKGDLISIGADNLDVKGSFLKPYAGLPKENTIVSLFDDHGNKLEGTVVYSEEENDMVTRGKYEIDKQNLAKSGMQDAKVNARIEQSDKKVEQGINNFVNAVKSNPVVQNINEGAKQVKEDIKEAAKEVSKDPAVKEFNQNVKELKKEINNDPGVQEFKHDLKELKHEINNDPGVKEFKHDLKELKHEINNDPGVKEFKHDLKELKHEINNDPGVKDFKNSINDIANQSIHLANETLDTDISLSKMNTFKEGNFDVGLEISKEPGVTGRYVFDVQKIDEQFSPLGSDLISGPHSTTLFLAQSVGVKLGTEASVGYKVNLGLEVNRPFKNDFSISAAAMTDVGVRKDMGAFWDIGLGIEGRYQVDKNISMYAMPFIKGDIISKQPDFKNAGIELGVNIKF